MPTWKGHTPPRESYRRMAAASAVPLDKKALKAQEKAAKAAEKEAAKAAKAAEKEAAKVAKQEVSTVFSTKHKPRMISVRPTTMPPCLNAKPILRGRRAFASAQAKENKKKTKEEATAGEVVMDGKADGGKGAAKAAKAAAKSKKAAEKELLKEQKKIDKAAKKAKKKGQTTVVTVGQTATPGGMDPAAWTDDVDDGSTLEPGGPQPVGSLVSPDGSPAVGAAAAKPMVTPLGGASTPETADVVAFLNPVTADRNCWVQRRDKKCLVLYDNDSDSFLACARLVVNKLGKDQFWRVYRSPQAMTCDKSQLAKEERLGYIGKLDQVVSGAAGSPNKFTLFDQRFDKAEHLNITLKKKGKAAAYKVRCPNIPGSIYRSTEPNYDKATKTHTYPSMSLENAKESIKNFVLVLEGGAGPEAGPDAAKPPPPPPQQQQQQPVAAVEMGKRFDDEWDMRVRHPFSIYQAFGMAVAACYGT